MQAQAAQKKKGTGAIRAFFSYYKPHRGLFAIDLVCSFTIAACNLVYPGVARVIMNDLVPNKQLGLILLWAGILLAVYVLKAALTYIVGFWGHVLGVRIQADMRHEFFSHVERLPFSYFDETKTGTIMSRIVNDLFETSELAHHGPEDTFTSIVSIIGAVVMLLFVDPWLALMVALFVPLMVLFAVKMRGRMHGAFSLSRAKIAEVNAEIESSVSGIRVTKAYTAEEREEEKFDRANGEFKKARSEAYRYMGVFQGGMGLFNDLLYLIALVGGGLFFYFDRIGVGDYTAFILYVTMLLTPIRTLVNLFEQIQDGLAGFARFREVLALPAESEPAHPLQVSLLRGDVQFDDVCFSYKNAESGETAVLDHLSFTVREGTTVALVGPSGGGKTTVCHLIPRFYEPDAGAIRIGGVDIRAVTRRTPAAQRGHRRARRVPLQRQHPRKHRLRQPRRGRGGHRRGGQARRHPRLRHVSPARLRHRGGRAGRQALGRAKAAHLHRARLPQRPAAAHPRRGDQRARQRHRAADPRFARRALARPHDHRRRPPPLHRAQRRRDRRARGGEDRRARHP